MSWVLLEIQKQQNSNKIETRGSHVRTRCLLWQHGQTMAPLKVISLTFVSLQQFDSSDQLLFWLSVRYLELAVFLPKIKTSSRLKFQHSHKRNRKNCRYNPDYSCDIKSDFNILLLTLDSLDMPWSSCCISLDKTRKLSITHVIQTMNKIINLITLRLFPALSPCRQLKGQIKQMKLVIELA